MNTKHELIQALIHQGKYNGVTDACNIIHPDKKKLIITESYVDKVRMIVDEEQINVLIPTDLDERAIEESALTDAITSGDIYDDAEKVKDQANLIRMTTMPNLALSHNDLPEANNVTTAITPVIGAMNDNGRFASEDNMKNGVNLVKDLVNTETPGDEVRRVMDNYLSNKTEDEIGVQKSPVDIAGVVNDVKNIQSVKPEDTVAVGDYDVVDVDNEPNTDEEVEEGCKCDEPIQEGFFNRPKKLKPISRDIIQYVNEQIRMISTSRDQAMLASYVSNKLEFVDFYITVIDTHDDRFIVPHTRDYLTNMQNDLNRLLNQILHVQPVNKYDRVWKMTYPDGYAG